MLILLLNVEGFVAVDTVNIYYCYSKHANIVFVTSM